VKDAGDSMDEIEDEWGDDVADEDDAEGEENPSNKSLLVVTLQASGPVPL